jgi:inner membrane protein
MPDFLFQPWMWFVAALVLIGVEILAPGLFMLWLGLAAGLVGLLVTLTPLSWPVQGVIFAVSAIVFVFIGRAIMRRQKPATGAAYLNQRGDALVGREFALTEAIVNGFGQIRVDDTVWRVSGDALAQGSRVRVTGVEGSTLSVEPL